VTKPEPPVEECDHEWTFRDESFDHAFGTETVHFFECDLCGKNRDMEPGDYCEDDYEFD
jgi:hypothetical protein